MKLSVRLTAAFTVLGLIVVTTVAALSWLTSAAEIREVADDELKQSRDVVELFLESELGRRLLEDPDPSNRLPETGADSGAIAVFRNGATGPNAVFTVPSETIDHVLLGEEVFATMTVDDRIYRTLTVALEPRPLGADNDDTLNGLLLYRDITSEERAIDDLAVRLAQFGLLTVVAVAAAGWLLGRRLAGPLVGLTEAVEVVAESGAPPRRIELDRSDEIGRLADRFNEMLSTLEVGRDQQRRLVSDASHELRTPLTALRLRTEYAATFENLTSDQRKVVEGAVTDLEQLSALVADLVDLATYASPADEEPQHCRLASIVEPVVERMAIASGRTIRVEADDSAALVYPAMIKSAVQNLVDNAVKYSPARQPVHVQIGHRNIEVRDHGPGIAPEDLGSVFDRFFRSPKARNHPGNGIGLAIVKRVAAAHNGSAFAANNADGGARVGFSVVGVERPAGHDEVGGG